MGQINFKAEDENHKRFKMVLGRKYGLDSGLVSKAMNEALSDWLIKLLKEEPKLFKDIDIKDLKNIKEKG